MEKKKHFCHTHPFRDVVSFTEMLSRKLTSDSDHRVLKLLKHNFCSQGVSSPDSPCSKDGYLRLSNITPFGGGKKKWVLMLRYSWLVFSGSYFPLSILYLKSYHIGISNFRLLFSGFQLYLKSYQSFYSHRRLNKLTIVAHYVKIWI